VLTSHGKNQRANKINYIHDLIGKKIMLEPHSYELIAYLKNEGISSNQFILYPHTFDSIPLINDTVEAMSAYITDEPFFLEKLGIKYQIFSPSSGGIDFYGDILFTTEEQIEKYPKRVQSFLDATILGWKYAFDNVDEITELIYNRYSKRNTQEHLKYEAEKMRVLIIPDIVEVGYMNIDRWKHIADTYSKLEMMPKNYSIDGFIYDKKLNQKSHWWYVIVGSIIVIVGLLLLIGFSHILMKFYTHCKCLLSKD
jgi:ABC-type nitrate/sulfonate/bicarbonate transport system substrate-binding protein